jgi:hypothetical protein
LLVLAACASTPEFAPEGARISASGALVQRVAVPPEQPRGEVRIESIGLSRMDAGGGELQALHLRMTVSNDGDPTAWTVDSRQQLVDIAGRRTAPLYANSDRDSLPLLRIGMRDQRVLDLYYPLPPGVDDDDLAGFDLLWSVSTGQRKVAQRTPFGRVEREPYPTGPMYAGWGPFWWHDPYYGFYGPRVVIRTRPVIIRTPSHHAVRDRGTRRDHRR